MTPATVREDCPYDRAAAALAAELGLTPEEHGGIRSLVRDALGVAEIRDGLAQPAAVLPELPPTHWATLDRLACYWAGKDDPPPVLRWVPRHALMPPQLRHLTKLRRCGLIEDPERQDPGRLTYRLTEAGAFAWRAQFGSAPPPEPEPEPEPEPDSFRARLAAIQAAGNPFDRVERARKSTHRAAVAKHLAAGKTMPQALRLAQGEAVEAGRREWDVAWAEFHAVRGIPR